MGVAITKLLETQETNIDYFQGKIIAIDAMNILYQFVTTIRQHDGTPLKDSHGNITSHLTGLFSRCSKLIQKGLKLVFVFDGEMPALKRAERERRENLKEEAISNFEDAKAAKDIAGMKKFASRTARITKDMLAESKELISAFGIPIVEAPSEGEAQAAYMVRRGDCDIVASQDIDCMIYNAPCMVRNLSLSNKKKKINTLTYKTILPEIITLDKTLKSLDITLDQLRALAILVGTDFNVGGIKGLGPKKSLTLVKKFGEDFDGLFEEVKFKEHFSVDWKEVFDTIKNIKTTNNYNLVWKNIDEERITELLVNKHDFSKERISNALEAIKAAKKVGQQTSLSGYFG